MAYPGPRPVHGTRQTNTIHDLLHRNTSGTSSNTGTCVPRPPPPAVTSTLWSVGPPPPAVTYTQLSVVPPPPPPPAVNPTTWSMADETWRGSGSCGVNQTFARDHVANALSSACSISDGSESSTYTVGSYVRDVDLPMNNMTLLTGPLTGGLNKEAIRFSTPPFNSTAIQVDAQRLRLPPGNLTGGQCSWDHMDKDKGGLTHCLTTSEPFPPVVDHTWTKSDPLPPIAPCFQQSTQWLTPPCSDDLHPMDCGLASQGMGPSLLQLHGEDDDSDSVDGERIRCKIHGLVNSKCR